MKNTKQSGKFTLFAYQHKSHYFIGVCLEFDLIVEGRTLIEAKKRILESSLNYLCTVIKNNLSEKLLNFSPDPIYLKKYLELLKRRVKTIEKIEEKIDTKEEQKSEKLIPWDEYFSQDVPYNKGTLNELKKEKLCV
jgi:hypothetical protein